MASIINTDNGIQTKLYNMDSDFLRRINRGLCKEERIIAKGNSVEGIEAKE